MSGQFSWRSSLLHIPDQNEAVLSTCCQQRFCTCLVNSVAPLDCVYCTTTSVQLDLGLTVIRSPNADILVVRTTSEKLASWVPLNLLDYFVVALPGLDRALRLVDVPEVDELALASDGNVFVILPFYFEAFEFCVKRTVIELSNLLARI